MTMVADDIDYDNDDLTLFPIYEETLEDCLTLSDDMEYVFCGPNFNGSLDKLVKYKHIRIIWFGTNFNQPLDVLKELPNLEEINLEDNFKHSIVPLIECKNFKKIHMSKALARKMYVPFELTTKIEVENVMQ
jgi:hypothetical protein